MGLIVFMALIFFFLFSILVLKAVNEIKNGGDPVKGFSQAPNLPTPSTKTPGLRLATSDDPTLGPLNAKVTVVEFGDFECPYCGQAFTIIREISTLYKDRVRFIYRDFPLETLHPNAINSAQAGECAHEQGKFWLYHDKLFRNQSRLDKASLKNYAKQVGLDEARFNTCLESARYAQEVAQDFDDGVKAGVKGTPTWFINGQKVEGVIPLEVFKQIIDLELVKK